MRAATKHINTSALAHNLNLLSQLASDAKTIAVVKANAYGHGLTKILKALEQADLLAVAAIEEALIAREAGCSKVILLMEGIFQQNELAIAYQNNFELVIATTQQLNWLIESPIIFSRIWFKLDTGMGRLGFRPNEAKTALDKLITRYKQEQIVLMTHFSDADSIHQQDTLDQIQCFDNFAKNYPNCEQSLCNSAGTLAFPSAHRDYIRPGIALYGVSPFADKIGKDHGLHPVMTLKTRVSSVKYFSANCTIGYGQAYRMEKDGYIAICEIGYADGYLRFIPNGSPITIEGRCYRIAGRISMDMITVQVDQRVKVGDEVICWGRGLPIENIAKVTNTIPYQLLTTVTERPHTVIE